MKSLNYWVNEVHSLAIEKGWYDSGLIKTPLENHMLIVSEIAEASEEVRNRSASVYFNTPTGIVTTTDLSGGVELRVGDKLQKPEGEAVELADAVIRIMDYFGHRGWSLEAVIRSKHEYNKTRPYRHGGKAI